MGDNRNGWDGDLFLVNGKVWADASRGTPVRIGRMPDLFATDPALPATTTAERNAKARAAVEAAARAERDGLNAALGEGPVVCEECEGSTIDFVASVRELSDIACPACNGRGAVNGRVR